MADDNEETLFPSAPDLSAAFTAEAGQAIPRHPKSIADAIPAEIRLNAEHEAAIEADEQRWKTVRDSIANKQDFELTPDNVSAGRDLKAELDDARTKWEAERSEMLKGFEAERHELRESSITLSGDFELEAGEGILSEPNIMDSIDLPSPSVEAETDHFHDDLSRDVFLVLEDDHEHENED
jgi:hypothetical protein